jgi:hypothetical protein
VYNWAILSLEDINRVTDPKGLGLDARLTTLLCKKNCCKIKRSENRMVYFIQEADKFGRILQEKKGCFLVMIMMTMMVIMINKMIGHHDFCLLIFTIVIFGKAPALYSNFRTVYWH